MIKNLIRQMVAGKKQRLFKHAGISLFLLLMVVCSYGQIRFEKGYFITNENQRTECLIKNVDWKNNPHEFLYKLKDRKETQKGTIQSVKEFGIYG